VGLGGGPAAAEGLPETLVSRGAAAAAVVVVVVVVVAAEDLEVDDEEAADEEEEDGVTGTGAEEQMGVQSKWAAF